MARNIFKKVRHQMDTTSGVAEITIKAVDSEKILKNISAWFKNGRLGDYIEIIIYDDKDLSIADFSDEKVEDYQESGSYFYQNFINFDFGSPSGNIPIGGCVCIKATTADGTDDTIYINIDWGTLT